MPASQAVIVHAHCYQPPREDPWLEVVEAEPSAAPDHDWNARINRECYARLGAVEIRARDKRAAQRDPDARSGLSRIINLYAWCSFDAGATLCEWLEQEAPDTLQAMITGDAASVTRLGFGNAMAAPYHHIIMPLASRRDKVTEVRWGLADFRRRFGRDAQGMWLPECAVDEETLEVLALEGVQYTILAPYQVRGASGDGMPVLWRAAGGRALTILPYDGNLAGEVAFGNLLRNSHALAKRLAPQNGPANGADRPRCTTLATDGETFGHHHKGGEVAMAEAMLLVASRSDVAVLNAAALIAMHAPITTIELVSPSSWSCAHGVERWQSDCGCRLDGGAGTSQRWRRPLREAMNWLANSCHDVFEGEGRTLFAENPWDVRNAYGAVVATDGQSLVDVVRKSLRNPDNSVQLQRGQALLELERAVLRTFTSCAWFFDDVARIETRQILRYAARALELSGQSERLEGELLATLALARSNVPEAGTAADLYRREAVPAFNPPARVAAAAAALKFTGTSVTRVASYDVEFEAGRDWSATIVCVIHRRTGASSKYSAQFAGEGSKLEVTVAQLTPPFATPVTLAVADLPETAARFLLKQSTV